MPPKAAAQGTVDIRSFFGGKPKPKPAAETSPAAPKKVEEQPSAPPQPAAPPCDAASSGGSKPARTPSRGKGATTSKSNAGGTNSGSKGKAAAAAPAAGAPTAKSPASGSGSKKRAPAGRPTSRAQAKRKQVVDSDDEGGAGSDSWDDGGEESGSGSDLEVDLTMSDAEVEAAPVAAAGSAGKKQKEQQTKAPAAGKQKAEAAAVGEPAAKRAKATPRSAALKKLPAALQRIADNPHAMAAVAAVDAAAAKLPVKQLEDLTFLPDGYGGGKAPDEPPNRGGKRTPRGHPDCLTNKTFVITGVLDSLLREEAEDLIKRHGGKVTSSVSGKTSFLLAGAHMGRSKYYHAKDKGVPMIDEDGLFSLIRAAPPPDGGPAEDELPAGPQQARQAAAPAAAGVKAEPGAPAPVAPAGPSGSAAATRPASFYGSGQQQQQRAAPSAAVAALNAPPGGGGPAHRGESQQLWVEKWRPKTSAELVGNQGMVGTLKHWLRDWERVNLHGGAVQPPPSMKGKRDADQGLKKKAVLLSGPPGIGKTSAALIVCRELGYEPVEVNASDTRGKSDASVLKGVGGKLANAVKELSTNRAVSYDKEGRRKKLCLIMDEVDGMSAGDRGGVADLILTIKNTRVPIICICNEKYSTKLRSLRNHTLELDFRKPMVNQISKRMLEICAKEGLTVNQATMDALVQSANGGDIRLILGQLQMIRLRARSLSYDQVKSGGMSTAKDLEMSPFEAARRLLSFEGDGLSLNDQLDLVFQDLDLVPLLVQENYLNHRPKLAGNDAQRLRIIAKAADGVSAGDVATRAVRQYQNWSLAPFAAAMGTVYPATYMRGGREVFGLYPGEPNFPRFTSWLGNNSSAGKQRRLLGELHTRMLSSGHLECDRTGLRLAYLPVMRNTLSTPLVKEGKDGIPAVLRLMRDYCISREDVDFITDVTKFKTQKDWGKDPMKDVETQVKSAFTREFNKLHIKPKTGFGMEGGVSKKRRGKAAAAAEDDEEDAFGGEALVQEDGGSAGKSQGAEEEEEEELDPVLLQQKLKGMKHKGMTVTLKDGSTAKPSGGKGRGGAKSGGGRGSGGGAKSGGRGSGGGRGRGKK